MADLTSAPIFSTFKLESDPSGEAEIVVNQAREDEHLERQDMFSRITRVYDDPMMGRIGLEGKVRLEVEQNVMRLRRKEAYMTLGRVSGIRLDGKELFNSNSSGDGSWVRYAMSEEQFNKAWGKLPSAMAKEIGRYVLQVNPDWDPESVGE